VDLEGPKFGEVLVEIKATGMPRMMHYTPEGADPEGIFPAIPAMKAPASVDVGPGVDTGGATTSSRLHAECRHKFCLSRKTNLR
jgi:S-(hydroxymethyl)glutathione dehydrogenase/alcohol dehydrogenase